MWLKSISILFIKYTTWQNLMLSGMRYLLLYIYIYILIGWLDIDNCNFYDLIPTSLGNLTNLINWVFDFIIFWGRISFSLANSSQVTTRAARSFLQDFQCTDLALPRKSKQNTQIYTLHIPIHMVTLYLLLRTWPNLAS